MQENNTEIQASQAQSTATPVQQPQPQAISQSAPSTGKPGAVGLVLELVMFTLIAAVVSFFAVKYAPMITGEGHEQQSFVVVNMEQLTREQVLAMSDMVRSGSMDPGEMRTKAEEFSKALMEKMHAYSREGIVVLNSNAVVSIPEKFVDVTETVEQELQRAGVMLSRRGKKQD